MNTPCSHRSGVTRRASDCVFCEIESLKRELAESRAERNRWMDRAHAAEAFNVAPFKVEKDGLNMQVAVWERRNKKLQAELSAARKVVETARLIRTAHSGMCATVKCNCTGDEITLNELAASVSEYDAVVGASEEKK